VALGKSHPIPWHLGHATATGLTEIWRLPHDVQTGIGMDELLAGQWLSSRVCPHCGHPPDDFSDDETVVE
jgi:hypothetical protein